MAQRSRYSNAFQVLVLKHAAGIPKTFMHFIGTHSGWINLGRCAFFSLLDRGSCTWGRKRNRQALFGRFKEGSIQSLRDFRVGSME